jgi:hypothetical protein
LSGTCLEKKSHFGRLASGQNAPPAKHKSYADFALIEYVGARWLPLGKKQNVASHARTHSAFGAQSNN